jgi:chromosome segregation ATPase
VQDLQAQQSQWASEKAALEKERDDAKKEAETARTAAKNTTGTSPDTSRALAAERQKREAAEAELQRGKADAGSTAVALRTAETERARLAKELDTAKGQVDACTARNVQMYRVGQDVISAYENIDMADVVASRQPFAAKARAKLENAAQSFGDRLYEQRFDPRAGQVSATP